MLAWASMAVAACPMMASLAKVGSSIVGGTARP